MEENPTCVVCKAAVLPSDQTTTLHNDVCVHRKCFVCSCCGSNLDNTNYKLMENQSLSCLQHHESDSTTGETDFISTLRKFKSCCLRVNDINVEVNDLRDGDYNDGNCNFCSFHPVITPKSGYWIECTSKNCPKLRGVLKMTDKLVNSFLDLGSIGKKITKVLPEEIYENYFYGSKHWNYYSREEKIGPVILSIKQEFRHSLDFLRVMVRSSLHVIHGMIPVSDISSSPYGHEEVVQFLSKEISLESQLKPITLPTAPAELLKIDKVFLKDEYKVGIIYMKEDQTTEEQLFNNQEHGKAFDDFLDLLGDRVRLKGFGKYRGGLDIVNDLTGTHSVHATYGSKQIMFHVSTLLPFEQKDNQKLQRKRHIGNDIVCIVFLEGTHTAFDPECIKSNFLHTFVVVQVDIETNPHFYKVSVVSRNQVPLYGPSLTDENTFDKGPEFRRWILSKVINGEIASHKAPNFAKLHQRTRNQLMNELLDSVENSSSVEREKREPVPFREHGRWSQSSMSSQGSSQQDPFSDSIDISYQQAKDFSEMMGKQKHVSDVRFIVGKTEKKIFLCVKSVMAAKSSVLQKLLNESSPTTLEQPQQKTVQNGSNSPTTPRTPSWGISGSILSGGSRSRKFSLKKSLRSQSSGEDDVVLSSYSGLDQPSQKNGARHNSIKDAIAQEFIVEDFEPDEFDALLMYLHTGSCHITAKVLPGLLCAAYRYDISELQQVCEDSIEVCLDETTVYTFLHSMEQCPGYPEVQQMLQKKIDVYLQENSLHALDEKAASLLSEKSLKLILSRVEKEYEISKFNAIIEWAKGQSIKMDCCVSIEELAKPLLSNFVDLTNISPDDLMEIVYPSGLVSNDQLMVIMAVKADHSKS